MPTEVPDNAELGQRLSETCTPAAQHIYNALKEAQPMISPLQVAVIGAILVARACADEGLARGPEWLTHLALMAGGNIVSLARDFYTDELGQPEGTETKQ